MNRFVKISLWLLLAGAVLSAVLVAAARLHEELTVIMRNLLRALAPDTARSG